MKTKPNGRTSRLIGSYIRQKREILGLSQRELGQRLNPPVTTQFISNMERGVTPLPPVHIHAISQALGVPEAEITQILEKEFLLRITEKTKSTEGLPLNPPAEGTLQTEPDAHAPEMAALLVPEKLQEFFVRLCEAIPAATPGQLEALASVCEHQLRVPARVLLRSLLERRF